MRLAIFALATAIFFASSSTGASAETTGHWIARTCSNGTRIATLEKQAREAAAMVDPKSFEIYKQLALEHFRCSVAASDPYLKDYTKYFYAQTLFLSERNNSDADNVSPHILYVLNELAASTKFTEVRHLALATKANVKSNLDAARALINTEGPPNPAPTSSSR